jgi:hypothetical protein
MKGLLLMIQASAWTAERPKRLISWPKTWQTGAKHHSTSPVVSLPQHKDQSELQAIDNKGGGC